MQYEIIPLPKAEWKGTPILLKYTTEEYYDLETAVDNNRFEVRMVKKSLNRL